MHPHRVSTRLLAVLAASNLLLLPTRGAFAVTGAAPPANANPASQSLLSRLPDPGQFKKSPLENAVKDRDPIVNDGTFRDLQSAVKRGDAKAAFKDVRSLTTRFPNRYPVFHEFRGLLALRFHFVGEAENAFRQVTRIAPKLAVGWYSLSFVEVAQGRFPAAEADARASVKVSDSFAPGWMLLAVCQDHLGKTADATASATRATQVSPNSVQPWLIVARCKIRQGKQAAAIGDLEHARTIQSNNLQANEMLGSCYVQLNQPAKAVGPYQQALKAAPKNPSICRQLGYCYLAAGNASAAEQVCRQGVKLQPSYAPAWDMLGLCYRREGKQREAIDAFEHAVKAAPRDLNARAHLDEARLGVGTPRV